MQLNILVLFSAVFQTIEIYRSPVPDGRKKSNGADKADLEGLETREIASETQKDLHLPWKLADVANHI